MITQNVFVLNILFLSCVLVQGQDLFQHETITQNTYVFTDSINQQKIVYNPPRDCKRLLLNTGINVGMAALKFGALWAAPEDFSNWDKDGIRDAGWGTSWKNHVKAGPVKDNDSFFMNGIMHPWGGAVYYMSARGSGYRWWESFIYSSLLSTFMWEYGIEAFAEVPSWQDLIVTPLVGSVMGEGFFILKGIIVENDIRILNSRFLGRTALVIMDPVNEISDALGYKRKVQIVSSIVPVNYQCLGATSIGIKVNLRF